MAALKRVSGSSVIKLPSVSRMHVRADESERTKTEQFFDKTIRIISTFQRGIEFRGSSGLNASLKSVGEASNINQSWGGSPRHSMA
jgi:hypothetical protein